MVGAVVIMCPGLAGRMMRRNMRGAFWLLVAVLMWSYFALALLPMALFDDFCGWVERRFDRCFGDW